MNPKLKTKWWQKAVFYQIYPRSFADGNGDGVGDFHGMISKLDYLQDLGVDAIWISPHYPSPNIDCGYDISNYTDVAAEYGSLVEFKEFLNGLHQRGMRLVLDLVLNHTSDQNPWFVESRSSLENPKRDWYIWKKGRNGLPPTNWFSAFGGSAWEFDARTGEYYYHYFFKEQPDLNWNNPDVQRAMFDAARFWLDLGVDGFRLDAVGTIFEDLAYEDMTLGIDQGELFRLSRNVKSDADQRKVMALWVEMFQHQVDQPEVHRVTKALRDLLDEYDERVLIGETEDIGFYGNGEDELHLNFNFPLMRVNRLSAAHVLENQRERLPLLPEGAWPCNTLGNHDSPRVYSNFGDGEHNLEQAKLHLLLLLTLKGTPFLYYGEEIGMSDLLLQDKSDFQDTLGSLYYELEKQVMGSDEDLAVRVGAERGRDRNRTPMHWTNGENGGFCPVGVKPWLPVNPDCQRGVNIEEQRTNKNSLLSYYRATLQMRKKNPALQVGEYAEIDCANPQVLGFTRTTEEERLLVLLNFSDDIKNVRLDYPPGETIIYNSLTLNPILSGSSMKLFPYQGIVLSVV